MEEKRLHNLKTNFKQLRPGQFEVRVRSRSGVLECNRIGRAGRCGLAFRVSLESAIRSRYVIACITTASEESTTERLCCWPPLRVSDDLHRISVRVCDMETCIALVYWVSPSLLQILRLKHSYESGVSWPCSSR